MCDLCFSSHTASKHHKRIRRVHFEPIFPENQRWRFRPSSLQTVFVYSLYPTLRKMQISLKIEEGRFTSIHWIQANGRWTLPTLWSPNSELSCHLVCLLFLALLVGSWLGVWCQFVPKIACLWVYVRTESHDEKLSNAARTDWNACTDPTQLPCHPKAAFSSRRLSVQCCR